MFSFFSLSRHCALIISLSVSATMLSPLSAQPDPDPAAEETVDEIVFRDETTDQVLAVLERLTGRSIIRPHALPAATFSFNSRRPLTRQEAIDAIKTLLTVNQIAVTEMGDKFLMVVPAAQVRTHGPELIIERARDLPPSGRIISRLYEFEFLDINEIQTQLNVMLTPNGGSIIPFPKANALLITDTVRNLQAMEELIDSVDQPRDLRTTIKFISVEHARAVDIVSAIEALSGTAAGEALASGTTLQADERSNQIILATDRRQVAMFEDLIEQLDTQADPLTRTEVIPLRHANAVEVASLLGQIATGQAMGVGGRAGTQPGGQMGTGLRPGTGPGTGPGFRTTPGTQQRGFQSQPQRGTRQGTRRSTPSIPPMSSLNNASDMDITRAAQADDGPPPIPDPSPAQTPDPSPPTPGQDPTPGEPGVTAIPGVPAENGATDFSEYLTILADERSNAVILSGTAEDIRKLTELLEKLDVVLAQVRIEVFIAEVTLSDDAARGITAFDFSYEDGYVEGTLGGPGFAFEATSDPFTFDAAFSTAASRSDIQVLSIPTIVTTHNREASIIVAEERPIVVGSFQDPGFGTTTRSQVQYRPIGIQLYVRPLIGVDGTVQLEIDQSVEDIIDERTIDGNPQPIIGTRTANSFVTVHNRETIILGGLQSTSRRDGSSRLGILGQIPLLGNLFTSRNREEARTELMVFIRPTVLSATEDAHRDAQIEIDKHTLGEELRQYLDPQRPVRPHGLSDEAYELRQRLLERGFTEEDPVEYR